MEQGDGMRHSQEGTVREGRTLFMDYDDTADVLEHLEQEHPADSGWSGERNNPEESWDLSLGWEGALAAYTGGWAEGAQKAEELAERVIPRPIGKRTTLRRDVTGAFPNVGAFLAGAPNSMMRVSSKTVRTRPYVHLYLPIGYLAGIHADTAFNRGCAMVAIVDALEMAGCRVKVTLLRNSEMHSSRNTRLTMRFQVKDYGDRLDIDQLIFTAAHPAMFRRILFALQERSEHDAVRQETRGEYGRSCDPEMVDTEADGKVVRVILPRLVRNGGTPETFLEQMVKALPEELQSEIEPIA